MILFPLILWVFREHLPKLMPWLLIAVIGALLWRVSLYLSCTAHGGSLCGLSLDYRLSHCTDTMFDSILYGCLIAFVRRFHAHKAVGYLLTPQATFLAGLLLLLTLLCRDPMFRNTLRLSIQPLCVALLAANILFGHSRALQSINHLLSQKLLLIVGRMSYALYLFHFGALNLVHALWHTDDIGGTYQILFYLIVSAFLTTACYYLIEQPMLLVRERYRTAHTPEVA